METLRRVRIKTKFTEASALLPVHSVRLLARLGVDEAWWVAHDEAGLANMVSLVWESTQSISGSTTEWCSVPVTGTQTVEASEDDEAVAVTDAEAMAYADGMVFVFGSAFTNQKGRLDGRRSFVARFVEDDVSVDQDTAGQAGAGRAKEIVAPIEVLMLGDGLVRRLSDVLAASGVGLMELDTKAAKHFAKSKASSGLQPINIEGAAVLGDVLVLGLRWPVQRDGHPMLVVVRGGRKVLAAKDWSSEKLLACQMSIQTLGSIGTLKRPAGVRAMAAIEGRVHVVCGSTDRDLAASRARAAKLQHLTVDLVDGAAQEVRAFEGFRKVEALAVGPDGLGFLYALDDEDAVVLLVAA